MIFFLSLGGVAMLAILFSLGGGSMKKRVKVPPRHNLV
jgi:hypothetical protein